MSTLHSSLKYESVSDTNGDDEGDGSVYRPRPQLPIPQVNLRSLADLMTGLEDGSIDVNPEYQREVVWTAGRMTGLIDSLMENFYIPPIILNGKQAHVIESGRRNAGVTTYICVDGKQRLSSVRAFIKGMIPCHDHRGEMWWFSDEGGRRRKVLPEATKKEFLKQDFVAYQFKDLSQEQEEDLFARVQMGMQLSTAERMRASSGPWQELARLFVDDFPSIYNLMKDRARAKDFQLTLSCFSQILEATQPSNGIPSLRTNFTALPKFLANKILVNDGTKTHLAGVWTTMKELIELDPDTFTNDNKYLRGVQTFAPVEMVGVTVLLSMYSESRKKALLLGDIQALRIELRNHFVDLRLNSPTWKFIWEFCHGLKSMREGLQESLCPTPSQRQTRDSQSIIRTGAYSPSNNEQQWAGIVRSISPQVSPQTILSTPPRPHTSKEKRKIITHISPAQSQEVIDLSGENEIDITWNDQKRIKIEYHELERIELERRALLSPFRGKSAAGK